MNPTTLVGMMLFTDVMGFSALIPVLPELRSQLDVSSTAIGALVSGLALGMIVFAIPMGRATDIVGPRRITIIAGAFLTISFTGFFLVSSFSAFVAVRLLQGFASAAIWIGGPAWVALGDPATRTKRLAVTTALGMAGSVFGAALSGFLAPRTGLLSAYVVLGASALVTSVLILIFTTRPELPPIQDRLPLLTALRKGWSSPLFTASAIFVGLFALISSSQTLILSLGLGERGLGEASLGLLFAIGGAVLAAGQTFMPFSLGKLGAKNYLVTLAMVLAGFYFLNRSWPATSTLASTVIFAQLFYGGIWGSTLVLIVDGAEEAGTTSATGITFWNMMWGVGSALGPVGGGAVLDSFGEPAAFSILATLCLLAAGFIAIILRPRSQSTVVAPTA